MSMQDIKTSTAKAEMGEDSQFIEFQKGLKARLRL